ncbi:MAG: hypothetical protein V4620_02535 [Bacteroidota bacterium]
MNLLPYSKTIYLTTLFLVTAFIWWQLYSAQFLFYDENYRVLISAFFWSVLATIILVILWFNTRALIKQNALAAVLFLLLNSPVTVLLALFYYNDLFGPLKY